jgi:hypothetical protein
LGCNFPQLDQSGPLIWSSLFEKRKLRSEEKRGVDVVLEENIMCRERGWGIEPRHVRHWRLSYYVSRVVVVLADAVGYWCQRLRLNRWAGRGLGRDAHILVEHVG